MVVFTVNDFYLCKYWYHTNMAHQYVAAASMIFLLDEPMAVVSWRSISSKNNLDVRETRISLPIKKIIPIKNELPIRLVHPPLLQWPNILRKWWHLRRISQWIQAQLKKLKSGRRQCAKTSGRTPWWGEDVFNVSSGNIKYVLCWVGVVFRGFSFLGNEVL